MTRKMPVDIPQLEAFLAVSRRGGFSGAAEELHLTQPAVSKRIAALESALDTRLFDRIGKQVSLTEAGSALSASAERILAELADSQRVLSNLRSGVGGKLTIASSHHIGLHRLPPVLRAYASRYPDVALDLKFMDSEIACDRVAHGELELALITLPQQLSAPLVATPLWDDPLNVCVAVDHRLAKQATVNLRTLSDYPAILPDENTFTHRQVADLFARWGCSLQVGLSTNYLETIKMLVGVGLGWSALPSTMLDDSLVRLSVPNLNLSRQLGSVQHRDLSRSRAARAMLALLSEYATMPPINSAV